MAKPGPKPGGPAKGSPTGIRFEHRLKRQIAAAAKKAKRSFSDQVESMLRQSMDEVKAQTGVEIDDFGTPKTYALTLLIANAIREVECWTDKEWDRDAFTFEQAKAAAKKVFEGFFVEGETDSVPATFPALRHCPEGDSGDSIRQQIADEVLSRGLGNVCGAQTIDDLRTAVRLLRVDPEANSDGKKPGSSIRISVAAAREFRRRNMSYFRNLVGDDPVFFCRQELQYTPPGGNEPTHVIAVYRWERPTEKNPQGNIISAPIKGDFPVAFKAKLEAGGLSK